MKKKIIQHGQMEIFSNLTSTDKIVSLSNQKSNSEGKQVFMDNRKVIYEKILNRKME